ncbi:MAG TPA: thiamine pyrophosphate-binding protein [Candidatus Angelobacter sp.]|jgi:acetolactate synthase-1/2/3 large subunit|nr:thiamine pyrophosphate-binding protein [Candidatus Angelobacter sp.]
MSVAPNTTPQISQMTGAQAVVAALMRHGITAGFGIPSIHNIAVYEALRQTPEFHHWVVRHEQAAGYAADGFYRRSGQIAAIFASTGPGNLFTLVPLLESLQNNIPILLIGTNIASSLLAKAGGALHETPEQLEIIRPLTRFARRVARPDELPATIAEAVNVLRGPLPGPAFIEIPHDFFLAPVTTSSNSADQAAKPHLAFPAAAIEDAQRSISASHKPAILVGAGAGRDRDAIRHLAEILQCPVFTTTMGKGVFAGDHLLSLGCISRLGAVQEVLLQSDLLISFGARLTEFDTGRFGLQLPPQHIQAVEDERYAGDRLPSTRVVGNLAAIAEAFARGNTVRAPWCDIAGIKAAEAKRLEALQQDGYAALMLLRASLDRKDVLVNDQSILNYWASAFFSVLEPGTFLYPSGSGTLGYGLPAAVGVACAVKQSGEPRKIVCIAGDGGFQYTQHELATLSQYQLPVKILLVNDESYGIIGFLQRTMFGQTHEVALKNPDFCRVAEAYGIRAERITSLAALQQRIPDWLNAPGPALLEWRTVLKAPWEVGAIPRPTGVAQKIS